MGHEVGIAALKAHLAEHLRKVKRGDTVVVLERGEPIARLLPCENEGWSPRLRVAQRLPGDLARAPRCVRLSRSERATVVAALAATEKQDRDS